MSNDYANIVSRIAADMVDAMHYRMCQCGDMRPLFVYVSEVDGGWTIGHDDQHTGYWKSPEPVTCGDAYQHVPRKLYRILTRAPLFAGATEGVA